MSPRVFAIAFLVVAGCGGATPPGVTLVHDLANASFDLSAADLTGADLSSGPSVADLSKPPDAAMTVTSNDGFSASRTACINEINRLRATQSLAAYTVVNTDTTNSCVDAQATSDENSGQAHMAWIAAENQSNSCDGNAQDECEGYGTDPAGIVACLDSMWAEQNNANCKGCVGCTAFGGACTDCDFYGMNGPECGHYVNMSAVYFTQVACGFSTKSGGTWAAQNFFQ